MDENTNDASNPEEQPVAPFNPLPLVVVVVVVLCFGSYYYFDVTQAPPLERKIIDTTKPGPQASYVLENDPNAYLNKCVTLRDFHFLVIKGTLEHPGVSNEVAAKCGMRLISGTSEYPSDPDYQNKAKDYAFRFNTLLAAYLQKNPQN